MNHSTEGNRTTYAGIIPVGLEEQTTRQLELLGAEESVTYLPKRLAHLSQ